jgi:hypothetical protein
MSEELPSAGDNAIVKRVCACGRLAHMVDVPVHVQMIVRATNAECDTCARNYGEIEVAICREHAFLRSWLRRMPPLSKLESIDICSELDVGQPSEVTA